MLNVIGNFIMPFSKHIEAINLNTNDQIFKAVYSMFNIMFCKLS